MRFAWITNGEVAWQIPPRIAEFYIRRAYIPPETWYIVEGMGFARDWHKGVCGEMRNSEIKETAGV